MAANPTPRVFVSYSWTSAEHIQWVVNLCERLRADGVDVVLDQWDLKEGQDKYAFMERMVLDDSISRVLVICDEEYQQKADSREGGVGTESQIISKSVYDQAAETKFVPVVASRDDADKPSLPVYLRNRIHIDLSNPESFPRQYEQLLRAIYERPSRRKPPLGKPPQYLAEEASSQMFVSIHEARVLQTDLERGHRSLPVSLQRYLDSLPEALEQVRPCYEEDEIPFDQRVVDSIDAFTPARDAFLKVLSLLVCLESDSKYFLSIQEALGELMRFTERPAAMSSWNPIWGDNYRFILYELFVHSMAVLVKRRAWDHLDLFLDSRYFYDGPGRPKNINYAQFRPHLRTLEEVRKSRLELRLITVTGDTLVNRTTESVPLDELIQIDIVLFLRSWLDDKMQSSAWYPLTTPYASSQSFTGLPIFHRAALCDRYFSYVLRALKVESREELRRRCEVANSVVQLSRYESFHSLSSIYDLAGLEELCGWEPGKS